MAAAGWLVAARRIRSPGASYRERMAIGRMSGSVVPVGPRTSSCGAAAGGTAGSPAATIPADERSGDQIEPSVDTEIRPPVDT